MFRLPRVRTLALPLTDALVAARLAAVAWLDAAAAPTYSPEWAPARAAGGRGLPCLRVR
jgi:hypothetical protein